MKRTKIWWVATGVLVGVFCMFIISLIMNKSHNAFCLWSVCLSFSEAALVGALADWFAIVALFRHPMGLPIPHTAVLVKRREHVAESISNFVSDNFLNAPLISQKIISRQPTRYFAAKCAKRKNVDKIMLYLSELLPTVELLIHSEKARDFLRQNLTPIILNFPLSDTVALTMEKLEKTSVPERIIDKLSEEVLHFVCKERHMLEGHIADELPLPKITLPVVLGGGINISKMIAPLVVDKIIKYLTNVVDETDHPLRISTRTRLLEIIYHLREDVTYRKTFEEAKATLLESETLDLIIQSILAALKNSLCKDILTPGSASYENAVQGITAMARKLRQDTQLKTKLDKIFASLIAQTLSRGKEQIRKELKKIVMDWDVETMILRIEDQVGNDLQYIRMNGTIVGGIIGILLYFTSYLLG